MTRGQTPKRLRTVWESRKRKPLYVFEFYCLRTKIRVLCQSQSIIFSTHYCHVLCQCNAVVHGLRSNHFLRWLYKHVHADCAAGGRGLEEEHLCGGILVSSRNLSDIINRSYFNSRAYKQSSLHIKHHPGWSDFQFTSVANEHYVLCMRTERGGYVLLNLIVYNFVWPAQAVSAVCRCPAS